MADVFIAYSRLDHERVRPIADRLVSLGYSIWWDKHLRSGQAFADEAERALDVARVVLTIWSRHARNSTWVYAGASLGVDAGKFMQLRLDDVRLPPPFDTMDAADMSGGRAEWGPLEHALAGLARRETADVSKPATAPGVFAAPAATGATKLLTAATTAALAASAGAMSAAYNGVMTPAHLQIVLLGALGVGGVCAALSAHRLISVLRAGG